MKAYIFLILFFFISHSCAQQKFEKPPKPGKGKIDKIKNALPTYILQLNDIKKNNDSLFCVKDNLNCQIIDGDVVISNYTYSNSQSGSVFSLYAEGEFLEGKYQGIWKYYDKNGKVIKKEKWDNGKLIYRKEYK